MKTETRRGTGNKYLARTFRQGGKLHRRYIGKATDPVAQLLFDDEELAKAHEAAYQADCQLEKDNDIAASKTLDSLCQWSSNWKVITQLKEMQMRSKPTEVTATERVCPGLHAFNETCRRANEGDPDAQRQIDIWIAETPQILSDATDMIETARDYLIQFAGSASAESSAIWETKIDSDVSAILEEAGDDPFSRMCAEVVALAKMDVMRSSMMPYLAGGDMKRSSYWGTAVGRSQKRWIKISKAFRQHQKQSSKLQARTSSTRAKNES